MSEDKRRLLRTQGRHTQDSRKDSSDKRNRKIKVKSEVPPDGEERDRETDNVAKKFQAQPEGFAGLSYEENSHYDFSKLDAQKKPEPIYEEGMRVLSSTRHGESRIYYYPAFLDLGQAYLFFDIFNNEISWRQMNVVIRGKSFPQPRLVAWFGPFPYYYSGVLLEAQQMPKDVLTIKGSIESLLAKQNINVTFNSVLLNKYRNGSDSVAWHSDDELSMGIDPTIASVSLGDIRKFEIRRIQSQSEADQSVDYFVCLKHGSLLIMDGVMQRDWQHRVPKEAGKTTRINLTFRTVHRDEKLLKMAGRQSPSIT